MLKLAQLNYPFSQSRHKYGKANRKLFKQGADDIGDLDYDCNLVFDSELEIKFIKRRNIR